MADTSIPANAGSGGANFAVDQDNSGDVHPYAKIEWGPSGTQTDVADTIGARLPVKPVPAQGPTTDRSGTVAAGGSAQQLAASNATRNFLWVVNTSPTEVLYVELGAAATAASFPLQPFATFPVPGGQNFISTDSVSVLGATTGHAFWAKEG